MKTSSLIMLDALWKKKELSSFKLPFPLDSHFQLSVAG